MRKVQYCEVPKVGEGEGEVEKCEVREAGGAMRRGAVELSEIPDLDLRRYRRSGFGHGGALGDTGDLDPVSRRYQILIRDTDLNPESRRSEISDLDQVSPWGGGCVTLPQ